MEIAQLTVALSAYQSSESSSSSEIMNENAILKVRFLPTTIFIISLKQNV